MSIQRSDRRRFKGWYVRCIRRGVKYSKFFSDAEFGFEKSYREAEAYNRLIEASLPLDLSKMGPTKKSTTNILGVYRKQWMDTRRGKTVLRDYYVASWQVDGKTKFAALSVKKYGVVIAKKMAKECRNAREHLYRVR